MELGEDSVIRWAITQYKNHNENVEWFATPTVRQTVPIHPVYEVNLISKFEHITAVAGALYVFVGYTCYSNGTPWTVLLWQKTVKWTALSVIVTFQIT